MNTEELLAKIQSLEEELAKTKEELTKTKERLKTYTAPTRSKTFYDNHRAEILEKKKANPIPNEKRREYNKVYYLKKKAANTEI